MELKLKAYVSDKWRGKGNVVTNHWFSLKTEQENISLITLPNSQFIKPTDSSSSPGCPSRLHGKDLFKVLLSFTATDPLLYCYYGGYYHLLSTFMARLLANHFTRTTSFNPHTNLTWEETEAYRS